MVIENAVGRKTIDITHLNPYQYTLSLLKEGCRAGLIDAAFLTGLQEQLMIILKEVILRYTKGESSSVRIETAEQLLNSIYYTLDAGLRSFPSPEASLVALQPQTVRETYQKGLDLITAGVVAAKTLFQTIAVRKLDVPLEVYHSLIDTDLPDFFRDYSIIFGAHETLCSGDYPLVRDDTNLQGIAYIRQYLENLATETLFCSLFDSDPIVRTLANYGRLCNPAYRETPVNLFEILVNNAVFAVLAGNEAASLAVSRRQTEDLQQRMVLLSDAERRALIELAFERVQAALGITDPPLTEYLREYQPKFLSQLSIAVQNNSLTNLALWDPAEQPGGFGIFYADDQKLDDPAFRQIVNQILACRDVSGKVRIIRSGIHGLADFRDLLDGNCLFGPEYAVAFAALTDLELAALCRSVWGDTLRDRSPGIETLTVENADAEAGWLEYLIQFLRELDRPRKQMVNDIINRMAGAL